MNQINDQFGGLERHQQQNLPAFHQFLNGNLDSNLNENLNSNLNENLNSNLNGSGASTSNIVIHINDSSDSIMQNLNLGLHGSTVSSDNNTLATSTVPSTRKRKKSSATNDSSFKCSFCPKRFDNQNLLNSHVRDCQLIRTHVCDQCGKRFKARGGLQQHSRTHLMDEDRPYQCSYCAKKFNQKSHLDQHERIHTGSKPFICQFCGRGFRQRSQQIGHESTHLNNNNSSSNIINTLPNPPSHSTSMVQQSHPSQLNIGSGRSSFSSDQSSEENPQIPSNHQLFLSQQSESVQLPHALLMNLYQQGPVTTTSSNAQNDGFQTNS